MCICENLVKPDIPEGHAGIIQNRYGYFMAFHLEGRKPEDTAVPIKYCPYCGRKLNEPR